MVDQEISLLGYALLGLLQQEPRSGYDLRKIFATTPMTSFSDSPGSIYPALRRLENRGLIRSEVQDRNGLRRRRLFHLTNNGIHELRRWQRQPIRRDDIVRGIDALMLRFAFIDESLGEEEAIRFLSELESELELYVPTLRAYLHQHRAGMPLSGRLALESGIINYEGLHKWVRNAIKAYRSEKKSRRKP